MEISLIHWSYTFFIFYYLFEQNTAISNITVCQNYNLLLGSDKDTAKVVEVAIRDNVNMQCHYCEKGDSYAEPKLWFYKKRGSNESATEITAVDPLKIFFYMDTLTLKDFSNDDEGIYFCQTTNNEDCDTIFTFVVEGIINNKVEVISTSLPQWKEYKQAYLDPVNNDFEMSISHQFEYLRKSLQFSFKIITSWGPWGPCVPNFDLKGLRKRLGKCLLRPIPCFDSNNEMSMSLNISETDMVRYFIIDNYDVSCRSVELNAMLPDISRIVRTIPDIEIVESCSNDNTHKIKDSNEDFKFNVTKQIAENEHFTLSCPETTLESKVEWLKDGVLLNDSFRNNMARGKEEPHKTIDSYNVLYIFHASKQEEGTYTCIVDGKKMQKFVINIVAKSKLLNYEFIRYSIYLGLVLSLTMICYCAGMCVAWRRRSSFVDPRNQNSKKIHREPSHD